MATVIVLICAAVVIGVPVVSYLVVSSRRGRISERVRDLYRAAATGDRDRVERELGRGRSIDLQDRHGDSALHHAYYEGRDAAVAALIAFGADHNLRNREGLTPRDMAEVRAIEELLRHGTALLGEHGVWRDEAGGRTVYRRLREYSPRLYNPAVVRLILKYKQRRALLHLAIKLGVPGSERKLGEVLNGFGDQWMATDYLNAGSPELREAAERWARRHGFRIHYTGGRTSVMWGRF